MKRGLSVAFDPEDEQAEQETKKPKIDAAFLEMVVMSSDRNNNWNR